MRELRQFVVDKDGSLSTDCDNRNDLSGRRKNSANEGPDTDITVVDDTVTTNELFTLIQNLSSIRI